MSYRKYLPVGLFILGSIGTGYLTWLVWLSGDDSKWLFLVFTLFLLTLAVAPLVPEFKRPPQPEPSPNTRFLSHRFLLLGLLVITVAILAGITGVILRR